MPLHIPSDDTLGAIIGRATRFLTAVTENPAIYRLLSSREGGYSPEHHRKGLGLTVQSMGFVPPTTPDPTHANDEVRAAVAACDRLDEPTLARVAAALEYDHPEVFAFVTRGLAGSSGVGAVANLRVLLDRLTALRQSPERLATRQTDLAALTTLATRGLDEAWLTELAALVERASNLPELQPLTTMTPEERKQARVALYYWHKGWASVARALITRRDWLISLGLAVRKQTASGGEEIVLVEDGESNPSPSAPAPEV